LTLGKNINLKYVRNHQIYKQPAFIWFNFLYKNDIISLIVLLVIRVRRIRKLEQEKNYVVDHDIELESNDEELSRTRGRFSRRDTDEVSRSNTSQRRSRAVSRKDTRETDNANESEEEPKPRKVRKVTRKGTDKSEDRSYKPVLGRQVSKTLVSEARSIVLRSSKLAKDEDKETSEKNEKDKKEDEDSNISDD